MRKMDARVWSVHPYLIYGPLLAGAATVLYEGKPVGTPDTSAFWRMIETSYPVMSSQSSKRAVSELVGVGS